MPIRTRAILGTIIVLLALPARADDDAAKARSRELNTQANRAMDAGDLATALRRYHDAYEAFPSPKLHFNLGLVLEKLGRNAEAADELQAFLDELPDAPADSRTFAREKVSALGATLGHVKVRCVVPGATVRIDETASPCDKARYVTPGNHTLDVMADGYEPLHRGLVVARGELVVEAGLVKKVVLEPTVTVASGATTPPPRLPSRVAPIALGAVSGAVLLAGFGLYGDAQARYDGFADHHDCSGNCRAAAGRTNIDSVGYAGAALIAVGGVGLVVDVALWVRDAKQRRAAR